MEPHPDYVGVVLPRKLTIGGFHLTPLSPEYVDEDFDAVMATAPLLAGIFGDWPQGLTREDNLIDLAWHEREFTTHRSFSWIIRDPASLYVGCFYISPAIACRGKADAQMWLCDMPDRLDVAKGLQAQLAAWMAEALPPEVDITWNTRPELDKNNETTGC
ncbi:MAG: hypothetical protein WBV62_15135 [Roseobacter sp.]